MSEIENSQLDISSHGITLLSDPIHVPTSDPTPAPTPEVIQETTPHVTCSNNVEPADNTTNVVTDNIEYTLVELIKKSLENEDIKKQNSIVLTSESSSVINNIISQTPNTLIDIEKTLVEIIKDDNIDSKYLPNLIIIIQRIYQFIYTLKGVKFHTEKCADITASVLKYILHFLVLERKIQIDENKQEDFFRQTDLLIDSCVGLLSYSKTLQPTGWFKKLFG